MIYKYNPILGKHWVSSFAQGRISKNKLFLLTRFSTKRSLLLKVEIHFPLNNLSLLWPIDTKLGIWVAYIMRQLGIAT